MSNIATLFTNYRLRRNSYQFRASNLAPSNLVAYWPLTETSGTQASDVSGNSRHGTYSGVVLASTAGPGATMGSAPLFDGINDFVDIYTASLAAAFTPGEFTLSQWLRVPNSGVWTDGATRRGLYLAVNGNNRVMFQKEASLMRGQYIAGATNDNVAQNTTTTAWFHVALTVSKSADQLKFYFNGAQSGATQSTLGTWVGSLLNTTTLIGATDQAGTQTWAGYIAHVAIWNTPLTATQIASLATAA